MITNPAGVVGAKEDNVVIFLPGFNVEVTKDQAIDLAVKLVAMTDDHDLVKFGEWFREFMDS